EKSTTGTRIPFAITHSRTCRGIIAELGPASLGRLTRLDARRCLRRVQPRSFRDVGSMSGFPETGRRTALSANHGVGIGAVDINLYRRGKDLRFLRGVK